MSALPPAFRRLASSNLAAQFSEQIALAAAPLVAVLALGATAAQTGYLQTAQTLPFLLLSLPAGVLADRLPRRTLMTSAECVRAASLLALLALLALGGALVGGIGAAAAYGLATLLSLLAAGLLAGLPPQAPRAAARRHLWHELRDGAAFVTGHPLLRPVLVTAVFFNLAWFVLQAVYVVYAVERLGLGAAGVGITLGVYGAGMLAGALAAPWLAGRLSFGALTAAGPLCALAASLILLSTLALPSGLWAAAGFFLFGAGPILWTIATTTLRQAITPNALLGRVSAVILTATFGARPVGALIGAALASRLGLEACLWVSSAGFAAQFVVLAASPVPRLRSQPEPVTG
ncbi:MFS transporter [Achromobacter xylosoxidans]|uniref:MFS transporter n=1 Tax=Alcaligenes xylosoxydans xylosoxydans TaxID=85698 RepID=UPI0038FBF8B4